MRSSANGKHSSRPRRTGPLTAIGIGAMAALAIVYGSRLLISQPRDCPLSALFVHKLSSKPCFSRLWPFPDPSLSPYSPKLWGHKEVHNDEDSWADCPAGGG